MATEMLSHPVQKGKQALGLGQGAKLKDLERNTKDVTSDARITSDWGAKQSNTDDWLSVVDPEAGRQGPQLLEDSFGREKIHRFDHERIPERVVHARGAGAFGKFKINNATDAEFAAKYTCAGVLNDASRETPIFVRFSTVLGSRGSADTVRDVRGFAVKFYTQEGNWDIVGNNIPVFFIQDAMKFPDVVHAAKPEPDNEVPQAQSAHNNFWDFQYLHSEATHMFFWTMSDRSIPRSYRMQQGFGVNTFTLIDAQGERTFVKFVWTPKLGVHSLVWDEALKLAGQDPDFHRKDLWEAIENGAYPQWDFGVQLIKEEEGGQLKVITDKNGTEKAIELDFDILDATKVWPESDIPVHYIGELELNRNVDEYFTQTEQVAFCTSHMVRGIGHSDDPLLQGRNFSYQDTQLSRLGINWEELPINRPLCPVMNHNRDGQGRHTITRGKVNYWPNRFEAVQPAKKEEAYIDYPEKVAGIKARLKTAKFQEHFNHAELFYNSLSAPEKRHLKAAFSFELDHCDDPIVYQRLSERLALIDMSLAQEISSMVGGPEISPSSRTRHNKTSRGLSQLTDFQPATPTIASRRIALLIADGYDKPTYLAMKAAISSQSALPFTIAPRRSAIYAAGEARGSSSAVVPDHHLEGFRSTMVDALFIPGGVDSIATLRKSGRALHWVREAFGHLKAIGATGEAVQFVQDAVHLNGMTFSSTSSVVNSFGVVTMGTGVKPESWSEAVDLAEMARKVKGARDFVGEFFVEAGMHRNWEREAEGLSAMVAY